MEEEQNWIFTFGSGQPHEGHYVKIFGTYGDARDEMFLRYGRNWAFQYSEDEWNDWMKRKPYWIPAETEIRWERE